MRKNYDPACPILISYPLKELFTKKGVYTPQQNGIVERKHRYLLETCQTLLFESRLPLSYWENVF